MSITRASTVAIACLIVIGSLIAAPSAVATTGPIALARQQLDSYFTHHPLRNDGTRSLNACPIGTMAHVERVVENITGKTLPSGRHREFTQFNYSHGSAPRDQELNCKDYIHGPESSATPIITMDAARLYSAPHLGLSTLKHFAYRGGTMYHEVSKRSGDPKFCADVWLPASRAYWVIVQYSSWRVPPTSTSCIGFGKTMVDYVIHTIDIMKTT